VALENLELKKGTLVMALKNEPSGKFVNGSIGKVVGFDKETDFPIVKFRNGRETTVEPVDWEMRDGDKKLAGLTQIPLKPAYAITVHKSQGMTLDAARLNLANCFEPGMGYVALSRVKSLQDLSILGLNSKAFFVHPEVSEMDEQFKNKSAQAREKFEHLRANKAKRETVSVKKKAQGSGDEDLIYDEELFEKLRQLRAEIARAASVPPYVVFHDKHLKEMAARKPGNEQEFLQISGVGSNKLKKYGEKFLRVIKKSSAV
jgi:hypothetical protein